MSVDLPTNPKLYSIDDPAAGWAYVVALCYSAQSLTDGHFPLRGVMRMANVGESVAEALIEQGLWHVAGHDCERCEQPKAGHGVVHDYLQHQRSAGEVRDLTDKRRAAGRRGAQTRWSKPGGKSKGGEPKGEAEPEPDREMASAIASAMPNAMASAIANAEQVPWQNDGKPIADEMRGEEITLPTEGVAPGVADDDGLFPEQPSERTPTPPRPRKPSSSSGVTASDVIKAFIDASREAGLDDPTSGIRNRVGRDAKRLLVEDKVDPAKVLRAADIIGRNGWTSLDNQIRRFDAERVQQGRMNGGMSPNPRILRNSHENQDRYDIKL
ncbi:hypothetical protein [Micromonospora sonchi]|uniref:hypothetical protein n=1 Tax=Micromonospora sonchi TaxID=1763543 RepID=UPI00166A6576|nr:hypothetical protein [Micromonospora sonchi]